MAIFTNYATLSYSGGVANSNVVTGEILETISATKTALTDSYTAGDDLTYVISLINSGSAAVNSLVVTDDLGGYTVDSDTVYPLRYVDGSLRYFVNGVLQPTPTVNGNAPVSVSGISIPANSNAMLIYEASVTGFAPLDIESSITNTATITGSALATPVTAEETVSAVIAPALSISKSVTPSVINENGRLTYIFVIENRGNTATSVADNVVLTDNFDPILNDISVTFNGEAWTDGTNYNYDETNGLFSTLPGQITVPAATYTVEPDRSITVIPGVTTLTVSGTI